MHGEFRTKILQFFHQAGEAPGGTIKTALLIQREFSGKYILYLGLLQHCSRKTEIEEVKTEAPAGYCISFYFS